jgi:spermidine/putrescine transport system permease protein
MHIWSMLREGISPEIAAIATITVSASVVMMLIGLRLLRGSLRDDGP